MSILYDISLQIAYEYEYPADSSRHIVRLTPADLPGKQRQIAGTLNIDPMPAEQSITTDFFGNRSVELAYYEAHQGITFVSHARVERIAQPEPAGPALTLAQLKDDIQSVKNVAAWAPHHFVAASLRVSLDAATTAYAANAARGAATVLDMVAQIGTALHDDFTYDPKATTVETPMLEAFHLRKGVCQDFTHIMIACLRGLGIPAGYVSGFLRTTPPPGKKRLEGADAMHAWVRAWCGAQIGWVEFDPTNANFPGLDYITIARGRDYADVAPIKGVLRSFGKHTSTQKVDVVPVQK
jgi:transglutaminase-like putative cysteine protease